MTPDAEDRNPVVLVHGIDDSDAAFDRMGAHLRERGWEVFAPSLAPSCGRVGLDSLAGQLRDYIAENVPAGRPFDLVGFSMGGIISRYYLQRLGGRKQVNRFITLSSPHFGTVMAYFRPNPGTLQMRPGSKLLKDLNGSLEELESLDPVSIWSPLDLVIVPQRSSHLPIGKNIRIPVLAHQFVLRDRRCIETVAAALEGSEPGAQDGC